MKLGEEPRLREYPGRFKDGSPAGWKIVPYENSYSISVPGCSESVLLCDWLDPSTREKLPQRLGPTPWLWVSTLAWLPLVAHLEGGWDAVRLVLREQTSISASEVERGPSRSADHQVALRVRTYLTLAGLAQDSSGDILEDIIRAASNDLQLVDKHDLAGNDNHGIMLAMALMHADYLAGESFGMNGATWADRLLQMLSDLIDSQGLAPENTPQYQGYYVAMLDDIIEFLDWYAHDESMLRRFRTLHGLTVDGFRSLLLPDGAVPPIGDGSGGPQGRFDAARSDLWSPENGIAVFRGPNTFVSLVCGFRSVIHKQLDDGSICWWYDGSFVLRDAGLIGYDFRDPNAVRVRTQRGHSSAFYERFDAWTTDQVISFGQNRSRFGGRLLQSSQHGSIRSMVCERYFDGNAATERSVTWDSERASLHVTDQFLLPHLGAMKVRFLLDPAFNAAGTAGSQFHFISDRLELRVEFVRASGEPISVQTQEAIVANRDGLPVRASELIVRMDESRSGQLPRLTSILTVAPR